MNADEAVAAVGEIRQNPGGRRVLVLGVLRDSPSSYGPRGPLYATLQLNGRYYGEKFGVPAQELDKWPVIATLPPDDYGAKP